MPNSSPREVELDPARLPLVFTEHGCLMLSNVLRSRRAIEASVLIVRAFVRLRSIALANQELMIRIEELSRVGLHAQ